MKTIREHLSGLARHIDIRMIMLQNSHMTLEEVLSLLPSIDHLPSALENALSADEVGATKRGGVFPHLPIVRCMSNCNHPHWLSKHQGKRQESIRQPGRRR